MLVTCLYLPFLPGEYDGLAVGLATMALLFGFAGVIMALFGACWLLYEIKKSRTAVAAPSSRSEYYLAIAAMACSLPVAGMVTIGALVTLGVSAAILVLVTLAAYVRLSVLPRVRRLKYEGFNGFNPAPLYLVALPVAVLASLYVFGDRAVEFSRRQAMANAAPLINDIEAYRERNGKYPESLFSEVEDYKPLIRGVPRYHYEPSGEAYNVIFEQFAFAFGTREFVAYNKRDEQEVTAHDIDLLQVAPQDIYRGYHASYDAGLPHWKIFLFD